MLKLNTPSKYCPFDAIYPLRHFFPLFKTVFEFIDFNAFWYFCHFLFHLFYINKTFPFEDFFHPGNKQTKVAWGKIRCIGNVVPLGSGCFWSKLLNTQCCVNRCVHNSPIMKWANASKESSKNPLKLSAAPHSSASGYTDTDGFLEHSPSGGILYYKGPALQKIIPFWGCFFFCPLHSASLSLAKKHGIAFH